MGMTNYDGYPIAHDASADETNPTTATILADTGALEGGIYRAHLVLGASAAAKFAVQRRNAANSANVGDVVNIYVAAGTTEEVTLRFALEKDERVRVTMLANLTGTASAAIQAQRVA